MVNDKEKTYEIGYSSGYDDGVNNARTDILAALTLFGVPDDLLYYLGYDSNSIEIAKRDIKAKLHQSIIESDDSCMAYPYVRLRTMLDILYCMLEAGAEPALFEKAGFDKDIIKYVLGMNESTGDARKTSLSAVYQNKT